MMRHILLTITALMGTFASADDHLDTFINTDVFELEVAADPQISPDGTQIAYVRTANDIMTDRARSNIWIVSSDGVDHRPLLSGTASYSSPRWSHDGNRLAYVSSAEGRGPQLYVRWMDTGQTALLSNLQNAPVGISWSPDDSQIAFSALVATEQDQLATAPARPEGADWAPGVRVISDLNYRADGRGYLESGYSHIFLLPADGGTPRQITQGEFNHGGKLDWTTDGNEIIFSANRNDDWRERARNSDLWLLNTHTGEMRQLTDRQGPDYAPSLSPDGSRLAYLGYEDRLMGYHNAQVSILDLNSGQITQLTEGLDRSIDSVDWAGSSSQLLISFDDFGQRKIASVDMEGNLRPLVSDAGSAGISRPYTSGSVSVAGNGAYAYTAGGPQRPADVALGHDDTAIRLTDLNADLLDHKQLGEVREISWRS
ncbi:MAG: TolB family protein, partial [Pseudohongiellaceae bacterium]